MALAPAAPVDKPHHAFYRRTIQALNAAGVPFLIGGAFALSFHIGTSRRTKDLDVFVLERDLTAALEALSAAGYRTEITDPSWLGKAFCGADFVDVIFGFGNGVTKIDEGWFEYATPGELWGEPVLFSPLEESLWSKAFVQERDRFDGADIAHIILLAAERLDWRRVIDRFDKDWRVLLGHLILVGFIYPSERARIPSWVMHELLDRLQPELETPAPRRLCYGPDLSRTQYVADLEQLGMLDAREHRKSPAAAPAESIEAAGITASGCARRSYGRSSP
jgi:hypothetical protein